MSIRISRQHFWPIVTLTVMPLALAAVGRDWLYNPMGYLDPWHNVGFFLHYSDPNFLSGHYKEARVSWIAPGFLLYKLFGPLVSNFILHIGALITSTVFVYLTLARLIGRNVALIVATLLTVYFPFLGSGGWDYQTTPSGAYYAVTLYLLTRGAQAEQPRTWLVLAGAAFAATCHANVTFASTLPLLTAHYLVVGPRHRSARGVTDAMLWALVGGAGLTLVFCVVAWSVGRSFFFFWPLLKFVLFFLGDAANENAWLPWSDRWLLLPGIISYLAGPTVVFAALLIWLAVIVARRNAIVIDPVRMLLVGQYAVLAMWWIIWQSAGHVALQPDYFAYPLIVPMFLAIGGMASGGMTSGGFREAIRFGIVLATLLVGVLMFSARGLGIELVGIAWTQGLMAAAFLGCFALAFSSLVLFSGWPRIAVLTLSYAGFMLITVGANGSPSWSTYGRTCAQREKEFKLLLHIESAIKLNARGRTRFWAGPRETEIPPASCGSLQLVRDSLSAMVVSIGAPIDDGVEKIETASFIPGDRIAILAHDRRYLGELIRHFEKAGKRLLVLEEEQLEFRSRPFDFAVLVLADR